MTRLRLAILATACGVAIFASVTPAAAQCTSNTAMVTTDRSHYAQAEIVTVSGCGLRAGEFVGVLVAAPDGRILSVNTKGRPGAHEIGTEDNGRFTLTFVLPGRSNNEVKPADVGRYTVTVMSLSDASLADTGMPERV